MRRRGIALTSVAAAVLLPVAAAGQDAAGGLGLPLVDLSIRGAESNQEVAQSLQLVLLLSVLALAPSLLILTTSFLRIAIVFDFIKLALSLQQVPPNQVLMGIALILTLFIMWPTFDRIYRDAVQPFTAGELDTGELFERAEGPLRHFMFQQLGDDLDDVRLFMNLRRLPRPATRADVPTYVLVPAFILHELTTAFKIGILIFIPFVVIDLVVAATLVSMGIIVLPPMLISMPFKLMLFVLVDGWGLLTMEIARSFA